MKPVQRVLGRAMWFAALFIEVSAAPAATVASLAGTADLAQVQTTTTAAASEVVNTQTLSSALAARAAELLPTGDAAARRMLEERLALNARAAKLALNDQKISASMEEARDRAQAAIEAASTALVTGIIGSAAQISAASGVSAAWRQSSLPGGIAALGKAAQLQSTELAALLSQIDAALLELDRLAVPATVSAPLADALLRGTRLYQECARLVSDSSLMPALLSTAKEVDSACQKVDTEALARIKALQLAIQQLEQSRAKVRAALSSARTVLARHGI